MNDNIVVSKNVAADLSGKEGYLVKLTSTGLALAGASDRHIGVLRRGNDVPQVGQSAVGLSAAVALVNGYHVDFAQIGATTAAIAIGDELQIGTSAGTLVPKTSGTAVALAWDSASSASGGQIRVLFI